ncbi:MULTISPECIES: LytR/AlgR family response regulator transcription factor [Roseivirga]|jgi:two-component system LytT family response regulator|uniref:Two-component system response regulator n=1 Tax=Roseivirga spongicola TaxID=333140 RepID=A0A150XH08_9BACT|nr:MULTISPECIES: LytTR family DNA-binding domain-containing protein [Roseivirga]KYG77992.1 two-component system response regulator [Roseivirga spongicola]MBO6497132.1 response regulator transcription factor [Roseivirga sp.]MBO6661192.1 response regulator transcription factor [Roseivirga sp.]MBO6762402.1 response regulator transcription factor [Roseivirga sp.]MBO6908824.1 response regulator transcription factor [Roseivirga sp.]
MKTLIVDDSRLARNELKRLLKEFDNVNIIGEAANVDEALDKIAELKPDLVFLDIQMPGKSGFDLLEELESVPEIIFSTAYDEHALKAFEYNALDYLVKPVEKQRLAGAVSKVFDKIKKKEKEEENGDDKLTIHDQVFVKDGEKCWFVQLSDIRLFEVSGNYTTVYFGDSKPMITRTLNYLESRLDDKTFFRANRQQIINLKWIERIEPWFSGSLRIYLKGGEEIDVSRRQTLKFKDLMSF